LAGDALDRILGKLDDMSHRLAVVETRQDTNDALVAAINLVEKEVEAAQKDVNGVGHKLAMHEQSPGHVVMLERLTAIEASVKQLSELEIMRKSLNDHFKGQADRNKWLIGTCVGAFGTMLTALGRVVKLYRDAA
jgi:hypothetical protein